MKKTLQINIAGLVFTIEEDAYEKLDSYLKAIQSYFSSYEGSNEIISDIEARIAEKFIEKTKTDGSSVITLDEVNTLVASMGTVADFEAMQEEEDLIDVKNSAKNSTASTAATSSHEPKKRLFRDTKRKALGGVLAGLAHYFNVDVTWIRIIYLLLFMGLSPLTDSGISGVIFIAYLVCWVAFPPNDTLEEDPKIKKFFRNPDDKVIGGVASGLSAYFGIDIAIIRVLFGIGFFFFGTGFIAYIILWIAAPEAQTLTQKMEMKGEPVTLENIETNIKKSLDLPTNNMAENSLTKVILFPFRALAAVLSGIGLVIKNLGPVARVFLGIILFIKGLALSFAALVVSAVFFGLSSNPRWINNNEFLNLFTRDISPWAGFFGTLAFLLPAIAILLLGLSMILNRKLGNRNYWLTGLSVWLVGVFGLAIIGGQYSMNFARKATHEATEIFAAPTGILVLDSQETDEDSNGFQENIELEIEGHSDNSIRLNKTFSAAGTSREVALQNAKNIGYKVTQRDSVLLFDDEFMLSEASSFREQRLRLTLYVPYNKPFKMKEHFANELWNNHWDMREKFNVNSDNIENFTFVITQNDGMQCLDCPKLSKEEREAFDEQDYDENFAQSLFNNNAFEINNENKKRFDVKDFNKIDIGNAFHVVIRQGTTFSVEASADRQEDLNDMKVRVRNNTLEVEYEDTFVSNREKVVIFITMPLLNEVNFSGAVSAKVIGFEHQAKMGIYISGASKAALDMDVEKITMEASGASFVDLRGKAATIDMEASGASSIDVSQMTIERLNADASGASSIYYDKVASLNSSTSGASSVKKK